MKEHGFNGFMWVMTLGLLAYWGSVFVRHYFPRENSVEIPKVSLGTLQPGSKVEFLVIVTNNGLKEIALKPIMTSCGCLAHGWIEAKRLAYLVQNFPDGIMEK